MLPALVLFDLDGTLVDSKRGIERCAAAALAGVGLAPLSSAQLVEFIGPPLHESFADLGVAPDQVDDVVRRYRTVYEDRGVFEFDVFDGVADVLDELARRGVALGVATSKLTALAVVVLEAAGLAQYFTHIVGVETDGSRRDKTEVMAHALDLFHVERADDVVMVGDRKHDVHGARNLGTRFIGVTWGYGPADEFTVERVDVTVDSPQGLLEALMVADQIAPAPTSGP